MLKDEISNGIAAHGMWKSRLRMAIETGKLDVTVSTISADNQCAFGKWLYGTTDTSAKNSAHYKQIKELHAEFHKAAGKVAQLATSGHKDEADKLMSGSGEFANISSKLTRVMMEWQKNV